MKNYVISVLLGGLCLSIQSVGAEADMDDLLYSDFPVVISATKSKQSLRDAPATVT